MSNMHHDELFLAIGRLEGKLDSLIAMQGKQGDELKDHDIRIRSLEQSKSHFIGYAAAAGGLLGLVAHYAIKAFA
jgi:cystathionine beta-lyase family protein involved in aluminum resistance